MRVSEELAAAERRCEGLSQLRGPGETVFSEGRGALKTRPLSRASPGPGEATEHRPQPLAWDPGARCLNLGFWLLRLTECAPWWQQAAVQGLGALPPRPALEVCPAPAWRPAYKPRFLPPCGRRLGQLPGSGLCLTCHVTLPSPSHSGCLSFPTL